YGVLSIYALSPSGFDNKEMELLEGFAGDLGLALHTIEGQQHLASRENLHARLFEALRVIQLTLTPSGNILGANPVFASIAGSDAAQLSGRSWRDFLTPIQSGLASDTPELLEKLRSEDGVRLAFSGVTPSRKFLCKIVLDREMGEESERLILVGYPLARQDSVGGSEASLRLEMIAALAGGVSHEVGDLGNGLINYAQVLADEEQLKKPGQPQNVLLTKIIETGERIAEIIRKFILYGQEDGSAAGEFLPVSTVLEDALLLIGYHLKSEGVQVETDLEVEPPVIPVHAQEMQQVFLGILNSVRATLGERYAGRDPRKKINVATQTVVDNFQGRIFEISIMDFGAVVPPETQLDFSHGKEFSAGSWGRMLALCRRIVEDHGGLLSITGEEGKYARIAIRFPLHGD
ncbi:MAG: PAS domain-containing sensor histidine kinase, partial [Proteobacteria bacterium]|nr:PAS domain-containing sensor histidine kinase [Pseudomonadota bacterium]